MLTNIIKHLLENWWFYYKIQEYSTQSFTQPIYEVRNSPYPLSTLVYTHQVTLNEYEFSLLYVSMQLFNDLRYSSFLTSCSRAPNREWVPIFVVHSIETRVFNHSTRVFKFVDRHWFTSVHSSSNSSSMHCEYITNSDSSLRVHMSSSYALFEQ